MSKIARYTGNLRAFGSDAQGLERTLFGETMQGDDLTSQITPAFLRGWGIVGPSENPSMEDFNGAMFAMSQFIAYQHQMGIPEWDEAQEYYIGSLCVRAGETYSSLTNNNTGSAPPSAKWTQVITSKNGLTSLGLVNSDGFVGRLLGPPRVFNNTSTYTPTDGTKQIIVELIGGGGGGGGCFATAYGQSSVGSSGSGGGYSRKFIKSNFAGVLVTIGTGGSSGVAVGGGQGGTTSFGSIFSATGGFGGVALPAQTTFPTGAGTNPPGQGNNGDINANGEWAQPSIIYSQNSNQQHIGNSGGCFLGGGVRANSDSLAVDGLPGTGGSGVGRSQQLTALAGGRGGNGVAIIWEYA